MPIRLMVGLGNPGSRYERTRHNLGFIAADAIVRRHGFGAYRRKFQGELAEGMIAGERVYALKPQTYMNASGDAVGEAARFYKLSAAEIAVLHDELDLAPGKLRAKLGGGTAGHNGLLSVEAAIGADFWRVRLGIGHPGVRELVQPYLFQNFDGEEMAWVAPLLEAVAEALPLLVIEDAPGFMNKVALILKPPPPKPPREGQKSD